MAVSGSMSATLGAANPLRYRGYVYDSETSLYYLSSRYYNPVWGRFINADTAAVVAASPDKANWDKNLFAYCDNDPVSRKDDGGDLWEEITTLGDSIFRSALIFGGLAIGAAVLSAFVVGTGGAGAIAIPMTDFKPYVGRKRRSGTGCVSEINDHLFEGRYSPKWPDGKKHARNVYAHTREECEEKLKVLIVEMKAEIAEAKRLKDLGEGDGRPPERKKGNQAKTEK